MHRPWLTVSLTLALALTLGLYASTPAAAGNLRQPVLAALSGIEDLPTAQDLQGLGEGVGTELLEVALDPSLTHTQRARATVALGWFPTDASLATLSSLLVGADDLLARKAAFALATGWADQAVPQLTTALASDSVQLRMATARALGGVHSDSAKAALSNRLDAETNSTVQDLIRAQLTN